MPLDQPGRQSAAGAQAGLDAGHPSGVALVIIAKEVQQAVKREDAKLGAKRVPRLLGLRAGHAEPDDDVAQASRLFGGKRQDVRRTILPPELFVERANALVWNESDCHAAPGLRWSDPREPPAQARSPHPA